MPDIDLLAILTRPDFPSGHGPIGDHMGLARLAARRSDLAIRTVVLNSRPTRLHVEAGRIAIAQGDDPPIELDRVKLALYMPVCLETEETTLAPLASGEAYPLFAQQQWRPVTEYLEHVLPGLARCVNEPRATRLANNKLIQLDALRRAGFEVLASAVGTRFPDSGPLAAHPRLVRKNVSEGGWKSDTEFSPARVVAADEPHDGAPVIWQALVEADHELRCYVMGQDVTFVRLEREPAVLDVRMTKAGRPTGAIVPGRRDWAKRMLDVARCLGLDYAVIDAMPVEDRLAILEVNANGVWWFLPDEVGAALEARFHAFLERMIAEAGRAPVRRRRL